MSTIEGVMRINSLGRALDLKIVSGMFPEQNTTWTNLAVNDMGTS